MTVLQNKTVRKIFGSKTEEVTLDCSKLHNEELYNFFLAKYYSGNKMKEDELDGACGTYGEVHIGIWWGNLKDKYLLEHLGIDGRLLKWVLKKLEGVEWIHLAFDRGKWRAFVNLRVP
jgi:hypothetical protein